MYYSFTPRTACRLVGLAIALLGLRITAQAQTRVLFVGNSFTHGQFTPALYYNSGAITDLNYGLPATDPRAHDSGMPNAFGGVPGIFKKFTTQAGLNYTVQIEAVSGKSLQFHHTNALSVIAQPGWDKVVLQEQSTRPVPDARGGSRALFYDYSTRLEQAIHAASPAAQVYLYQTWARADITYPNGQPYSGFPVDTMAQDLRNGYNRAFTANGRYTAVAPVGDAWLRAITTGVAMRNPYAPDPTKVNLWNVDNVHASAWGSYLSALVLFYQLTNVDPRTLGASEQAAAALSITPTAAMALQQVAYQQVSSPNVTTAFVPGNVAVVRVGDGTATLTSAATPEFVDEYTLSGTLVRSIPMPTANSGTVRAFTNSGTATSDNITRSADGRYLLLTGYNAVPGTAGIVTSTVAANNRLVARIGADGSVDTNTRINDAFSGTNIRSAVSANGSTFYVSGGNSGIRYLPFGNTGPTTALSGGTVANFRILGIADGNLYVSSATGTSYGLNQIGTGLPTAAGAAVTRLPGFPSATGPSSYGFYFADLSSTVPGVDVVYVADDNTTGGIQKWSLVGGTWTLNGTIGGSATAALRGLTGQRDGTGVQLVASGGGGLYNVTDQAGYNAAPSTAALPAPFVPLVANTSFRGVAFAPLASSTGGGGPTTYYLINRWKGTYLADNNQVTTYLAAANGPASQWTLESVNGNQRIRNVASGRYLNVENQLSYVQSSGLPDYFTSSQWVLEPYAGFTRIRNVWQGSYVNVENQTGNAQAGAVDASYYSGHWTLQPVTTNRTTLAASPAAGAGALSVFPNPLSQGPLTVLLPLRATSARLRLLDGQGRVVADRTVAVRGSEARLDVAGLATGLYLLQAIANGITYTAKVAVDN